MGLNWALAWSLLGVQKRSTPTSLASGRSVPAYGGEEKGLSVTSSRVGGSGVGKRTGVLTILQAFPFPSSNPSSFIQGAFSIRDRGHPKLLPNEGVQRDGGGYQPHFKPCPTFQWQLAGCRNLPYLTLTTWCCTDSGFQAPSRCEGAGEGLRLEPWEHRAARSPSPGRELSPLYSCGARG